MYQPNISKSPLLESPIIERGYATGVPEPIQTPQVAPQPQQQTEVPKNIKFQEPQQATSSSVPPQQNGSPEQSTIESDPVETFSFQEDTVSHLDEAEVNTESVEVEIPDDVAKETAKQITMLLDMGVAMLSERKLRIDMNSIKTSIAKGEMHPVFEEKFEQVNANNEKVAHFSKDNQKVLQQAFATIIKDQKIQAINPTNAAIANIVMVGISHIAMVSATIQSNENMIRSALEQTVSNEVKEPQKDSNIPEVNNKREKQY